MHAFDLVCDIQNTYVCVTDFVASIRRKKNVEWATMGGVLSSEWVKRDMHVLMDWVGNSVE